MTIALYRKFRQTLKVIPVTGRMMPYDWARPPKKMGIYWMFYIPMLDDFSREIANTINGYTTNVHRLRAWSKVMETLTERQKHYATLEFIDAIATNTVNLPYVIRNRIAFSATHLCHKANILKHRENWKDDLPSDDKINRTSELETFNKYGKSWKAYDPLREALFAVNSKEFQGSTENFRNTYHHRFSTRLIVGNMYHVARSVDQHTGKSFQALRSLPPLNLAAITDALESEQEHLYAAFKAFQELIHEQLTAIADADSAPSPIGWQRQLPPSSIR